MGLKHYQFSKEVRAMIDSYKENDLEEYGNNEPLDGDEVDRLTEHFRNLANLQEGNITEQEYLKLEVRK